MIERKFWSGSRLAIYGALLLALVFFALPAWFALINSFKPLQEIQAGNVLGLPSRFTFAPWIDAWATACTGGSTCAGMSRYFINSLIVALPATLISTGPGARASRGTTRAATMPMMASARMSS